MANLIATDNPIVVVGMGLTGLSVARYLANKGANFFLLDTRKDLPKSTWQQVAELQAKCPSMKVANGSLDVELLTSAKQIVLSPGVPLATPEIQQAKAAGVEIIGDIDLFLAERKAPVVGITGSNGKSTVTTLVGLAAENAGMNVAVGGNIGVPVLDLLADTDVELYVLELSSFQLESVKRAQLDVACVLNVSPDHMDRYPSLAHYCQAKQRIYFGAKKIVYNLEDTLTIPPVMAGVERYGFSSKKAVEENEKHVLLNSDTNALSLNRQDVLSVADIKIAGAHNLKNALAALAICDAANIPLAGLKQALQEFEGLPHRCQWVANKNGVTYINDSKATNIGSAQAAIEGLAGQFKNIVLIAGGDGKGADFSSLGKVINQYVSAVVLIGVDAPKIQAVVDPQVMCVKAQTLNAAVKQAALLAKSGDLVLLSPACASLDMFANYEARGHEFALTVAEVSA